MVATVGSAEEAQDHTRTTAAAVPASFLEETSLCGDEAYVANRIAEFKEAGVTVLNGTPIAKDLDGQRATIAKVKELSE